ncbi:hypothetical protein [Suttonella ornithocola]|uniref:Lipoprotein n=1 Tax=Suttonella ornithocola TaxID=279832 RepID=A0A380N1G5_9GAMM|nr:hypothetical protein [Suttonella ornithocola]SUO97973.1 Uncharacterised protein [Suttonella ornithocola]
MRKFSGVWLLLFLTACVNEGQYQEVKTVQFGNNSANQIMEMTQGSYRQIGAYPIAGNVNVHTPNVSARIVQPAVVAVSPEMYPVESTRVYRNRNTSIKRGTVYPTGCTHQVVRHSKVEVYSVPCYH